MNSKKGLSRIMSALLAASSMIIIGGADVSAGSNRTGGSNRKRKAPGVANGVSQKLSSGSDLYKFLAVGGGSALVGGFLTAAGMHFFGGSEKKKNIETVVKEVLNLNAELFLNFVKDIGNFLSVFDNSRIEFEVNAFNDLTDGEQMGYLANLKLNVVPHDEVSEGSKKEASTFLQGCNDGKVLVFIVQDIEDDKKKKSDSFTFKVSYEYLDTIIVNGDADLGGKLNFKIDKSKLSSFSKEYITKVVSNDTIFRKFCVWMTREHLLFRYLRKGYHEKGISNFSLAKICRSMWNIDQVKRDEDPRKCLCRKSKGLGFGEFMGVSS